MNTNRAILVLVLALAGTLLADQQPSISPPTGRSHSAGAHLIALQQSVARRTILIQQRDQLRIAFERLQRQVQQTDWKPFSESLQWLNSPAGRELAVRLIAEEHPSLPPASAMAIDEVMPDLLAAWIDIGLSETPAGQVIQALAQAEDQLIQIDLEIARINRSVLDTPTLAAQLPQDIVGRLLKDEATTDREPAPSDPPPELSQSPDIGQMWRAVCRTSAQDLPARIEQLLRHQAAAELSRRVQDTAATSDDSLLADGLRQLLEELPDLDRTGLMRQAVLDGQSKVLQVLLEGGASPAGISDAERNTLLHAAVRDGRDTMLARLTLAGADPGAANAAGETPLRMALSAGQRPWAAVMLLAEQMRGDEMISRRDRAGSPELAVPPAEDDPAVDAVDDLLAAVAAGSLTDVQRLLDHGAPLDQRDAAQRTALHLAAAQGQFMLVELLLVHGSDRNAQDSDGSTPLHLAAAGSHTHAVLSLLAMGSDPRITDRQQRTPSMVAGIEDLAQVLVRSAAADIARAAPPTTPDANLPELERQLNGAVVLVGHPSTGWLTGFVISTSERLVVTTAEASNIHQRCGELYVRTFDGQQQSVTKVLCHPGTLRIVPGTYDYLVRSPDPVDGSVSLIGPQVALLKIDDTARLEAQLDLRPPFEETTAGQSIILCGPQKPSLRMRMQQATIAGEVLLDVATARERLGLMLLRHDAPFEMGWAGAPVLLPDGQVTAVVTNMLPALERDTDSPAGESHETTLGEALPVDVIWQMLAYYELAGQIQPGMDVSRIKPPQYELPDPGLEKIREAVRLVQQANRQIEADKFQEASQDLNTAVGLAADLPSIYVCRAHLHTMYVVRWRKQISPAMSLKQHELADAAAQKALQLAPGDVMTEMVASTTRNNLAGDYSNQDPERARSIRHEVLKACDSMLRRAELSDFHKAQIYNLRAGAHTGLSNFAEAEADWTRAIELLPQAAVFYENRAFMYELRGDQTRSRADLQRARELRRDVPQ